MGCPATRATDRMSCSSYAGDDFGVGNDLDALIGLEHDGREEVQHEIADEEGVDERLPQPDGLWAVLLDREADLHRRDNDRVHQQEKSDDVKAHLEAVIRVDN
eukprot:4464853-Prymnesium_polylepis.1